ncbi:MAG: hypothetical protein ACE5MI_01690 [Acidimicrobiia bacterium]
MDGVVVVVVAIASLGGLLMPALLLDLASFWPFYLVGIVAGVVLALFPRAKRAGAKGRARHSEGGRRRSRRRVRTWLRLIAPLFVLMWLVVALTLHFVGWIELPSAAGDLRGPDVGSVMDAEVAVAMSGLLTVSAGTEPLYEVALARAGGDTGVPESLESITVSDAVISMRETHDSFWFETSGWNLRLAVGPSWALDLRSSELDADLRGLSLRSARLDGSGMAALPTSDGPMEVGVTGGFVLSVPKGQPVEIVGPATVPDTWLQTEGGWRSPADGDGLLIAVEEGPVVVIER